MTEEVYQGLKNILAHRKQLKTEMIVDGYSGFIMLDKNGNPKVALHRKRDALGNEEVQEASSGQPSAAHHPHVFRHTFCTNYANDGMDIKTFST